jgi:hypothetical protein
MRRFISNGMAVVALTAAGLSAVPAQASESEFLQSLAGQWSGQGEARRTTASGPVGVNCTVSSSASGTTFELQGDCRALAIVRQTISASLSNTSGTEYEGVYIGPRGGESALAGQRDGDIIELQVTWAEPVNGDREARMQLEKAGEGAMVIRTIDTDPESGAEVVTSEINLRRD